MLMRQSLRLSSAALVVSAVLLNSGCVFFRRKTSADSTSVGKTELYFASTSDRSLGFEVIKDDVFGFEYFSQVTPKKPLQYSPMVQEGLVGAAKLDKFESLKTGFSTSKFEVKIDPANLCFKVLSRDKGTLLTEICDDAGANGLKISKESTSHVLGLGQSFVEPGSSNGDWMGRVRSSPGEFGNTLSEFSGAGGAVGNIQIPVAYFAQGASRSLGLLYDNVRKQTWDFRGNPFALRSDGGARRGVLFGGGDLLKTRQTYMQITGMPPLPPKASLGLWMSEFSYASWDEVKGLHDELRNAGFPIDGFLLDLLWFGGVTQGSGKSRMGTLEFDPKFFPEAPKNVADLRMSRGVQVMPIEESYVSYELPVFPDLEKPNGETQSFLAFDCGQPLKAFFVPSSMPGGAWWGNGGMIDWSNPKAGDFWHDKKRMPLIKMGITNHWIDLGEPEMYGKDGCYYGVPGIGNRHWDIHNLYAFLWARSIWRGYQRNKVDTRPFISSRSGAAGIQRYATGVWSGDIGGSLSSLAGHLRAQMHMSYSGIDYMSSDIGGFHRKNERWEWLSDENVTSNYTIWYANSMLFDYPARPHVWNMDLGGKGDKQGKQTSPTRIGHTPSNLENTKLRYELIPYLYSQAWKASTEGTPLVPPVSMMAPTEPKSFSIADVKFIGDRLLGAILTDTKVVSRSVYLPEGEWADWRTGRVLVSAGGESVRIPLVREGKLALPLFAKKGSVIPLMELTATTMNALGDLSDPTAFSKRSGQRGTALKVRVFPGPKSDFEVYEDDGVTISHDKGFYRTTLVSQETTAQSVKVTFGKADDHSGAYDGAPASRVRVAEVSLPLGDVTAVSLNGTNLSQCSSQAEYESGRSCFVKLKGGSWGARSDSLPVSQSVTIEFIFAPLVATKDITIACKNVVTKPGESVYVSGNLDELGQWDLRKALGLKTFTGVYPHWVAELGALPEGKSFEYNCVKIKNDNSENWRLASDPDSKVVGWGKGNSKIQVSASEIQLIERDF